MRNSKWGCCQPTLFGKREFEAKEERKTHERAIEAEGTFKGIHGPQPSGTHQKKSKECKGQSCENGVDRELESKKEISNCKHGWNPKSLQPNCAIKERRAAGGQKKPYLQKICFAEGKFINNKRKKTFKRRRLNSSQ